MKKKIPLFINEALKHELELSANVQLEKISMLQTLVKDGLNINLDNPNDAIAFIKKYTKQSDIESVSKQNELLFIKFDKEVKKITNDYPSLIKVKALEMFCTPSDVEIAKRAIRFAVSIHHGHQKLGKDLELEHFILNDEFVYNSKIDSRLKDIYTTFCKNNKQVELKELAEKLRDTVKLSIKLGLISDTALGINIQDIINTNTGEIQYHRIASIK